MLLVTTFLIFTAVALIYLFLTWNFGHWKKRGVPGPRPKPLLGNFPSVFTQKRSMAYDLDDIYSAYKEDEDFVGVFNSRTPQLLVTSPNLARRVYVTDFKHFHDNEITTMIDEKSDFIFANNPFALTGEKWKERRAELTPGLTASRIRTVFPVTQKICKTMTDFIRQQTRIAPATGLDAKDVALRFTSEVVTDCVLGLTADSFAAKPTPIMSTIKNMFERSFTLMVYMILWSMIPAIRHIYKGTFIPKPTEKFFVQLMQQAIEIRKSQPRQEERTDFLNYMLQLQEKKKLTTLQLTAHTMTFLLDGFETTATVISHTLLLLARNPATLEKLRAEVEAQANENGELGFDTLSELPYLDACIHEAIRVFPPALFANKLCTEAIELTNKNGHTVRIAEGQTVVLPLYSFMYDADFFPNPQEFQPERFLEQNGGVKKYREMGVYYGFGDGPRVCLGMRFALTQTKAAIVEILRNFNISVNPKTRKDNLLDPTYFLARLEGGIWLDFEARN